MRSSWRWRLRCSRMQALCVVCQVPAVVWCNNDECFLCASCDHSIHSSNAVASKHSRVKVCEVCKTRVSTFYCKNDNAFFCTECDRSVHSNFVTQRHHRMPAADAMLEQQVRVFSFAIVDRVAWAPACTMPLHRSSGHGGRSALSIA